MPEGGGRDSCDTPSLIHTGNLNLVTFVKMEPESEH